MTAEETKVTRKKFCTIFTHVTKGKSMINHLFQHLKYETKVTDFFLVHLEISRVAVDIGKPKINITYCCSLTEPLQPT